MVGILSGVLSHWRLIGAALLLLGVSLLAWTVKAKFARAAEADRIEQERDMAQADAELAAIAYKKADNDRVLMSAQIRDYQEQTRVDAETVTKTVKVYVKDSRACDVPVEVLKSLNRAMGQPE